MVAPASLSRFRSQGACRGVALKFDHIGQIMAWVTRVATRCLASKLVIRMIDWRGAELGPKC